MSGYQSLRDLISTHIGTRNSVAEVDALTDDIYNVWMPDEAEAVNEAKRMAEKQRAHLVKVRNDDMQTKMTANVPDIAGAM
ncbi:hypothetical protein B2J88_07940 [Rhodococcus sp. SRB_17]|nr:hypothetical protein [Rhodococcus sp. SRB_17]